MAIASKKPKAPFPYFGGKSRIAGEVWKRLGNVKNYVEPFCGSLAMLLGRPRRRGMETVNDADGYVANFWRAAGSAPAEVARAARHPVHEVSVCAWSRHLYETREAFTRRLMEDPRFFDAEVAGRWAWGQSAWIGDGFAATQSGGLPNLDGMGSKGVCAASINIERRMRALASRLERVRVACGDWRRVLQPSVLRTSARGATAVFLDPPYGEGAMDYAAGGNASGLAQEVAEWARERGDQEDLRIALCGYTGRSEMPDSWTAWRWKARGGYGSQGDRQGRKNAERECVWFSPHCLNPERSLFAAA